MHSASSTLIALTLSITTCLAAPQSAAPTIKPFFFATATLIFKAGPTSYTMSFPADGTSHVIGNNFDVSSIDISGFSSALYYCNFYTASGEAPLGVVQQGNELVFGPPQQIYAVACAPTPGGKNQCLPEFNTCDWYSNLHGDFELACCGFCQATKCRSFENPTR